MSRIRKEILSQLKKLFFKAIKAISEKEKVEIMVDNLMVGLNLIAKFTKIVVT